MGLVTFKLDTSDWERALTELGGPLADKAAMRAVNRTADNANTVMVRAVSEDMGLAQNVVRPKISIQRAVESRLAATLFASATRIKLIAFGARGPQPSRGKGSGVTAKLPPPGAGRYPHAFIAQVHGSGGGSHLGVFERKGRGRLPVRELQGPSVAQSFEHHAQEGIDRAAEMLPINMAHEVSFLVSQVQRG